MLTTNTLMHNRYLVVEQLSQDGPHAIYLAQDQQADNRVVLIEISSGDDDLRQAFDSEARALRSPRHPALAEVTDHFSEGDAQFIVAQHIEGDDLANALEDRGAPFTPAEVARWGDQLLDALQQLHAQEPPIVHGNIKPQSLKLTAEGQIVLFDFAQPESSTGAYASPEQAQGNGVDAPSDLYSLGATLYHLMTNRVPPDALARLEAVANGEPDPLSRADEANSQVEPAVADVLQKAMALNREERFASADEMRSALNKTYSFGEAIELPASAEAGEEGHDGAAAAQAEMSSQAAAQAIEQAPAPPAPKTGQQLWVAGALGVVIIGVVVIMLLMMKPGSSSSTSNSGGSAPPSPPTAAIIKLTARDMEIVFQELVPREMQEQIAGNPERKKKFVEDVKQFFAIAQQAESEGYANKTEVQSIISFNSDQVMASAYKLKNPSANVSEEEVNAYYEAHPNAFDDFVKSNSELEMQLQMAGPQAEERKKQIKNSYGQLKVIADRARSTRLDQDEVVRVRLLFGRSAALGDAYIKDLEKKTTEQVSPQDAEQYYNDHQSDFDEVHARHILISTEAADSSTIEEKRRKAEELLARIRKGEDFAKLATEHSDDPGSKTKGGDLDYVSKGKMVPEFEKAMLALKPGEVSDIVESQFGFHIIKVEDRRPKPSPATDESARQQIMAIMKQERMKKRIEEIAASSSIEIAEDFNATPKPAAQPPVIPPTEGSPPQRPQSR